MEDKIKEAVQYLKENKSFHRLLKEMKLKYKKTGKLTGKIVLTDLKEEEVLLLAPLDSKAYDSEQANISIKKFIEFFSKGRFENIDFLEVLKEFYKEELKTNREIKEDIQLNKEKFFKTLLLEMKNTKCEMWIISLLEYKKYGYNLVLRLYKEDKDKLKEIINNIAKGLDILSFNSEDLMPLAKFSSIVTRDSHYFDIDSVPGKLLINALAYFKNAYSINTAEQINELFYSMGIVRDEISNSTITVGLFIYDDKEELQGPKWFRREYEPLILSVYNINSIKKIKARDNKVYVFENPTVFYEVLKKCKELSTTLICISGQPNMSSLMILDKLREEGTKIYYSGDFDPEGIGICDNLKKRYGEDLIFLGMTAENYLSKKGDNSFEDRISKLDKITTSELQPLIEEMKEYKTAAYQELVIDYYVDVIQNK